MGRSYGRCGDGCGGLGRWLWNACGSGLECEGDADGCARVGFEYRVGSAGFGFGMEVGVRGSWRLGVGFGGVLNPRGLGRRRAVLVAVGMVRLEARGFQSRCWRTIDKTSGSPLTASEWTPDVPLGGLSNAVEG